MIKLEGKKRKRKRKIEFHYTNKEELVTHTFASPPRDTHYLTTCENPINWTP